MPIFFSDDRGRVLPAEPVRPGESVDVRPVTEQREDAQLEAFVAAVVLAGVGEMRVRDWLLTRQDHVRVAIDQAMRGGLRQLRRCGLV